MKEGDLQGQISDLQEQIDIIQKSMKYKSPPSKVRADKKYYSGLRPFSLRFKKNEGEVWERVLKQPNKSNYVKALIAKDLGYKNWSHYIGSAPNEYFQNKWDKEKDVKVNPYSEYDYLGLNDLLDRINEKNIDSDDEWKYIEKLFYFDEEVSDIACNALILGALPLNAWTKEVIMSKIEDILFMEKVSIKIDWLKFKEDQLRENFLVKRPLKDLEHKIDKHIEFYWIDKNAVLKEFNIVD